MKRALIIGASGGIGQAVCSALQTRGVDVVGLSRSEHALDVTDETSVREVLSAQDGVFDLILVATGALEVAGAGPEKTLRGLEPQAFMDQVRLNALGPMLVLKHAMHLMPRSQRSVFAALSARVGSIGDNRMGGWYSYRASKAALNQLVHSAAIELGRTHKQAVCVALHPGTVQTPFTEKYLGRHPSVPARDAARNLLDVIDGLTPADTGQFFDWAGKRVPW